MKNKIAFKLTLYFSAALLLFAIIIGGVFMTLFKSHTMNLYKTELEDRAVTMAAALSEWMGEDHTSGMMGGHQSGYGAALRFLDEITMADVWVVDENLELITSGVGRQYSYADLPADAETVVKEVFLGNTAFSEGFSDLLNTPTLTVGTPIESNGEMIGALLMHSPVEGIDEAISQGYRILAISILTALILSVFLSILFAFAITKPLKKMKDSAIQLAEGDYSAKTGVQSNDEIGQLAGAIDVLSKRLDIASRKSEQLDRMRRDFVANISHELRTPVTVIRGSLEALCDGVVTDPMQIKDYHAQMLKESLFLQRLVNDLLDLSRLQNMDFSIEMEKLSLCDVLSDAVRSAGHLARKKEILIDFKQDTKACSVMGDYGRLRQMFLIILDNAVKFSPHGGTVTVSLQDKTVAIADEGIGINQEDLPYIFERFYKARSEANKNGTGLGLAIAKQIADRHQITMSVDSKPGKGSRFSFRFA